MKTKPSASSKIEPLEIAKWFINRTDRSAGDAITHLKVQKLVYYAQAWYLANNNTSLFKEDIQAWTHGPATLSIWHEYKDHAFDALDPIPGFSIRDKKISGFLEAVYKIYGKYAAKELENMTHNESPWKITRGDLPLEARCNKAIDKSLMRDCYAKRIGKAWSKTPPK